MASLFAVLCSMIFATSAWSSTQLLMAEEPGCMWCARWNAEIGPIYEKTGEGAAAPLLRVDISDAQPDGVALRRPINFTPTFVLVVDGAETARIEGYPGEDFFWGLLGMMLDDANIPFDIPEPIVSKSK